MMEKLTHASFRYLIFLVIALLLVNIAWISSPGMDDMTMWGALVNGVLVHGASYVRLCLSPALCAGYPVMYPPLYVGIVAAGTWLFRLFVGTDTFHIIKYTIFVFYALSMALSGWYVASVRRMSFRTFLVGMIVFGTSLAVFLNAEPLGLIDVFTYPFFIAALLCYHKKRMFWFGMLFAVTCLTKWQALAYIPLILVYVYVTDGWRSVAVGLGGAAAGIVAVWLVLMFFPLSLFERSLFSAGSHQPLSAAPNFPWFTEMLLYTKPWQQLFGVSVHSFPFINAITVGSERLWVLYWFWKAVSVAAYGLAVYWICRRAARFKRREGLLFGMVLVTFCYFLFSTGVHENHLMLGVIAAMLLFLNNPTGMFLWIFRMVDGISFVSLILMDGITGHAFIPWTTHGIFVPTVTAVIVCTASVYMFWRIAMVFGVSAQGRKGNSHPHRSGR